MPISFNNNLMALGVSNNLESHYARLSVSVQRLSSGLRINSAADDAAGLAIRELMRSDVAALNQGMHNASDAISMIQVADGALGVIDEKLIRMKELAEQAATGTYNSTQRLMIDSEFQAMASEIERIARATDFNGIKLLDGSLQGEHDGSGLNATGKLLIIYFIFKHILLAQNRPESDADGSEVTESLSVIPFQVLSNWKIPDSSSLPFSDNSKLLHPDSNQENTREYVPARHDHLLLQAKTF